MTASVWIVAGPPAAGKSTVADLLLARLNPVPALLDKDTMYGGFVSATLSWAGRPYGEREGHWYDEHIKTHEYAGMTAVAKQIRSHGCPVLLSAPFTQQVHDCARWSSFVEELGGGAVQLVWIRSDAVTLRTRLIERAYARDSEKLRLFTEFIVNSQPDNPPVVPHVAIDNRLSAEESLDMQIGRVCGI